MAQKLIDEITYEHYKHNRDDYFEDKIIPSVIYDIFMAISKEVPYDTNVRCQENIEEYEKNIKSGGYDIPISDVLEYFPIDVKDNLHLLGEYIINTPLCMFLEPTELPYEMVIKLDGKSSNCDLNVFGGLLKEPYGLKNIILFYDYDPYIPINFLKLKNIYDVEKNKIIDPTDNEWLEYLQSGYTEIFTVLTMYHALWHLMTAYITCVAKENIRDIKLIKVFTMSEQNIFHKANEVKTFFLQSPLLFNTILYGNKLFMDYASNWVNTFVDTFDIDTHFETHILRGVLNPYQHWVPGFKENLCVIKNFAQSIIYDTNIKYYNTRMWNWNLHHNINPNTKTIKTAKLIEILYTLGSVYHSYTFEYQKMGFTELIYVPKIPNNFFLVLLSTLDWEEAYPIYGNYSLYKGKKYLNNFNKLNKDLEITRNTITILVEPNKIYKSFIYTNVFEATNNFCINTWNTRI